MSGTGIKKRIEWLDILKGFLIIVIVLSHSDPSDLYRQMYTPFFLTMFFFVSGYTFSAKDRFGTFLVKKLIRLAVPILVLGLVKIAVAVVLEHEDFLSRLTGLILQISGQKDDLWFLGCLFTALIIYYGVEKLTAGKYGLRLCVSFVLLCLGFLLTLTFRLALPWHIEIALIMVFYMALGKTWREKESQVKMTSPAKAAAWLMAAAYIALTVLVKDDTDVHLGRYEHPVLFFIASLLAVWPLVCLSKWLAEKLPAPVKCFLITAGQNTLFLYAFENYVIKVFFALAKRAGLGDEHYILPVICALLTVALLMYPALLVRRFAPWAVGEKKLR